MTPAERSARVKAVARAAGFAHVGVTDLAPVPHGAALDAWLARGYDGDMGYLHRQAERRKRPATITPGATHAVVLSWNYYTADPSPRPGAGRVAKYARGRDYHRALAPALEAVRGALVELGATDGATRAFVDAGPVPERELAQRAGLGWIGKNTMLIAPDRGSFTFLASVLTDLELAPDAPFTADRCGSCTRCLDACPTEAFVAERVLDATRCISYLTIEYRGAFGGDQAPTGEWIFGCDVCQDVCPWNEKFAEIVTPPDPLELRPDQGWVPLDLFARMTPAEFAERYGWTAFERPGLAGMRRNAAAVRPGAPAD